MILGSVIAVLCFVIGIGGGVLLRKPKLSSHATPEEDNKGNTREGDSTVSSTRKRPIQSDPIARQAAEQLFGQHFRSGYQKFHAERYSEAVQDFERATEVAPHLAEGHYYLGETYSKLFLSTKAEAAYRESLGRMNDFRPAQEKLAVLLHTRGAYREAISLLQTMDRAKPGDPFVQGELAINYLALGEPQTAIPMLEKFNETRGRQAWGYAHLGRAHDLAGDAGKAESLYREALELDQHFALAHHWLGLLLARTDRAQDAEDPLAEYDRLRKLQTTEHELAMALLAKQNDVQQLVQLAEIRFQLGKYDAARQTLQRAERLSPRDERLAALRKKLAAHKARSGK